MKIPKMQIPTKVDLGVEVTEDNGDVEVRSSASTPTANTSGNSARPLPDSTRGGEAPPPAAGPSGSGVVAEPVRAARGPRKSAGRGNPDTTEDVLIERWRPRPFRPAV